MQFPVIKTIENKLEVIIYIIKKHLEIRQCISLEEEKYICSNTRNIKTSTGLTLFFYSQLVKYSSVLSGLKLQTMMLYLPLLCQLCM